MSLYYITQQHHDQLQQAVTLTNNLLATMPLAEIDRKKLQHLKDTINQVQNQATHLRPTAYSAIDTDTAISRLSRKLGILWQPNHAQVLKLAYPHGIHIMQIAEIAREIEQGEW